MEFTSYMELALEEARLAGKRGEVPVGAVIIGADGAVLARAGNRVMEDRDPSAHAEVLAIREACRNLNSERLTGCSLYVTLEPCSMCASLISQARIARLYFGASDPKSGGVLQGARVFQQAQTHHKPEVYDGIAEDDCAALLKSFFAAKRAD
ncbi:MAG: nucleoside deaminase [Litoreibacter sp.]|nr:nucleoside deaminase [Litoreibacter sp.]